MLALILGFVMTVVAAIAPGIGDAPGLADLPALPADAIGHSQAGDALEDSGQPAELPANVDAPKAPEATQATDVVEASKPDTVPPVDVSDAPSVIDLTDVPANEEANVPETVGADDHAPDVDAGPPSDIPAEEAAPTGACAANAKGAGAADCTGS
jgi:hypothetical protein